jgi:type VI secretion system protein ImpM
MTAKNASMVGFYGKLPCRGDFLHRRVPQEFVDVWDNWVRESLTASRRQLQERWLDAYLTSPVWRFVLTEGLCGRDSYAGVILPSVDKVGRYFPLTIVARWEVEVSALETACNQSRWFECAEALALHALDAPALDFDVFDQGVADLAAQIDAVGEPTNFLPDLAQCGERADRATHWYLSLSPSRSLRYVVEAMGQRELERRLHPLSLWWTEGSNDISPGMLWVSGLPQPSGFAAMLSGERAESGWVE